MISEYTPVTWAAGEPITIDKLNVMAGNTQLLYEKLPRVLYQAAGITKDKSLRILATNATIPKQSSPNAMTDIYFGNFFSSGCRPMIALGITAYPQGRFHAVFTGLGNTTPDHRGITIKIATDEVTVDYAKITVTVNINVLAIGW